MQCCSVQYCIDIFLLHSGDRGYNRTPGIVKRDAGADNYPARRRARRGAIWVWLWVCGFDCCGIFDSFSLLYCMLGIQLIVLSLQMEDGDSDEGEAGHLLTAWLGELDTLKKVNREEAE